MKSRERVVLVALIGAQVLLRLVAAARMGVNSDEPQHLHVAWAWVHGLLPYRDVCDNHSPLFSLLMAPFVALVGERANIVMLSRLAMIPIVLAAMVAIWRIAARLFSPRVAWWSIALLGVNPHFLRASVEYRTDQLWMALWLWALAVAVTRPLTRGRAATAGLLVGLAASTSMKTTALLAGLLPALAWAAILRARPGAHGDGRRLAARMALAVLGGLAAPLVFALGFALAGSWRPMLFNVVGYNVVPGLGLWSRSPLRPAGLLVAVPLVLLVARAIQRGTGDAGLGARRSVVFSTGVLGWCVFELFWPLVVHSDILPNAPVIAIFAVAGLLAAPGWLARTGSHPAALAGIAGWLVPVLVCAEIAFVPVMLKLGHDGTRTHEAFERSLLDLTRPGDPVMDVKGEAVFRVRSCYLIIESITRERIARGMLPDSFPEQIVRARTPVVCEYFPNAYPERTQRFIQANYLRFGWLDVAGMELAPAAEPGAPREFTVAVPQRYALVTRTGSPSGMLDGTRYSGPRQLERGRHTYLPTVGEGTTLLIWAPALERGLHPFPTPGSGS